MTNGTAIREHFLYVEVLIAFTHDDMTQILKNCQSRSKTS